VDSSDKRRKRNSIGNILWLFFGGSFIGIALLVLAVQSNGWSKILFTSVATLFIGIARSQRPKDNPLNRQWSPVGLAMLILVIIIGYLGKEAGRGLAILATAGTYGRDYANGIHIYAEKYLIIAVVWLLLGVPHRAFTYKVDPSGKGNAQRVLVRVLVTLATILTGIYILLLLHFTRGPLHVQSLKVLIPGIIFAVFLIVPAYRSIAKACWRRGIGNLFSPIPLAQGWIAALTELDDAFGKAIARASARIQRDKAHEEIAHNRNASQQSPSEPGSDDGSRSRREQNPKQPMAAGAGAGRMLRQFGRGGGTELEPRVAPEPTTKIVRQQRTRQSRSKRSGKR
jgi:hypothetical protein